MWKDKSPGLKILWLWAFGTAADVNAVLVTSVMRTRTRDMEQLIDAQQDQTLHHVTDTISDNNGSSDSAQVISDEKS
ncbi:hypothetical protein OROGR_002232 [Orobanche gracilis]